MDASEVNSVREGQLVSGVTSQTVLTSYWTGGGGGGGSCWFAFFFFPLLFCVVCDYDKCMCVHACARQPLRERERERERRSVCVCVCVCVCVRARAHAYVCMCVLFSLSEVSTKIITHTRELFQYGTRCDHMPFSDRCFRL